MEKPILLLIHADSRDRLLHGGSADGLRRRTDFELLIDDLGDRAEVLDLNDVRTSRVGRLLERRLGTQGAYIALAWLAFRRRRNVSAIWAGSENDGVILALLLRLSRRRVPLVIRGIWPAKSWKRRVWSLVRDWVDEVQSLVSPQVVALVAECGLRPEQSTALPYQVDAAFWDPARATPHRRPSGRPYLFGAGLQHRDYPTLVAAAEGLGVDLLIAAASLWSQSGDSLARTAVPDWVEVVAMDYTELRDAYAGAAVVVAPTVETDFAPGMTVVIEAMSMGRPTVATRSAGMVDYLTDRRRVLRSDPSRATAAAWTAAGGQTGWYFGPGDVEDLRSLLGHLLAHPEEAAVVGARARTAVLAEHTVERHSERIIAALDRAIARRSGPDRDAPASQNGPERS